MRRPRIIIIAGPNGAGKTTFAREFLAAEGKCTTFINADLIAAGLSPLQPEAADMKAMRLMAEQMRECVANRRDFAVESTLSGKVYVNLIRKWQAAGYQVKIIYLWLESVDLAIDRVRFRVAEGGHNVPENIIRRRYSNGWKNFNEIYCPMVDVWQLYNCSCPAPVLMEEGECE